MPPWANTLLTRSIRPAAKEAKIAKRIGWHTFRHTYSTLLKGNGKDVKVVQELMRHANFQTTMNFYTRAITTATRRVGLWTFSWTVQKRQKRGGGKPPYKPTYFRRIAFSFSSFLQVVDSMVGTAGFEPTTSTV